MHMVKIAEEIKVLERDVYIKLKVMEGENAKKTKSYRSLQSLPVDIWSYTAKDPLPTTGDSSHAGIFQPCMACNRQD